jgi:hypothetical protein
MLPEPRGEALNAQTARLQLRDVTRQSLKPTISRTGAYDIPLRDEIELEYVPAAATAH